MDRSTQRLIKAIYFQKIATQITRKSPESIRRKRSVVHVPDETAYNLACRHVANFLYNHGMEMSLYVASIETAGVIPKKGLPLPVGKEMSLSEHKNLYQQLKRAVRPPDINALKPSRGFLKEHHHHHHHHSKRELSPTEAYKETANMLAQRASYEIRSLGMDPNDPATAQRLYDEFKEFLAEKKRQREAPPPPQPSPYEVMQAPPPPVYQSDGTSRKSASKAKTPSERSSYIEESYTTTKKSSASKSTTQKTPSTTAKSSTAKSSTAKSSTAKSSTKASSTAKSSSQDETESETESSSKSDPESDEEDEDEDHHDGSHGEEEEEEEEEDHGEEEGEGEE